MPTVPYSLLTFHPCRPALTTLTFTVDGPRTRATPVPLARIRRPSENPLLAVFLTATLAFCAWLAYQAVDAARSQRRTAEGVLSDYADIAASEFSRAAGEDLDDFLDEAFDDVPRRTDRNPLPDPADLYGDLERALRQADCRCASLRERAIYLRVDLPTGVRAALPVGVTAAQVASLAEEIGRRLRARPAARTGLFTLDLPGVFEAPAVVAHTLTRGNDDAPRAVYAIALDPSGVEELMRGWYQRSSLLPAAIAGDLPNDSLLSVRVHDPAGEVLFASERRYAPTFAGSDTLAAELGSLVVETAIRADAAEYLIIGGLPTSRVPLLSTLLVLTLGLGVAALVQLRRQQQLTRLREDFVSGVSHEFRTPLTQIRLFAELLRDGKLDADAPRERALSVINREASRLTHLVENVLRFSALRHGSPDDVRREDVEIRGVVDEVLEAFEPLACERRVRLVTDLPAPCHVQASRGALHQILTNLLDNALKYGPEGQTVRVAARHENGSIRLTVEDEGPGVPRSERARIWEPYQRLQEDVVGNVCGTGIGLAVVAELASVLGGRAWVEGREGPGSCFVVELSPWTARPDAARAVEA